MGMWRDCLPHAVVLPKPIHSFSQGFGPQTHAYAAKRPQVYIFSLRTDSVNVV